MTNNRLLLLEWYYLTDEAKDLTKEYLIQGVEDIETAVELAIWALGEDRSFDLKGASDGFRY